MDKRNILETIKMLEDEHLDIRTVTMGISLFRLYRLRFKKGNSKNL